MRYIYGKWSDYLKSARVDDYEDYMKSHSQKFRVPDKPSDEPHGTPTTPRKMISKLNSLTRQLTGSNSIDVPDNEGEAANIPPDVSNGEIPKSDSSHSLDIPNSRILWQVNPRPEDSPQYYHFTLFSMSLNQLDDTLLTIIPSTDSRLRPDMRKLEEGNLGIICAY